jgi:hypothetical protein
MAQSQDRPPLQGLRYRHLDSDQWHEQRPDETGEEFRNRMRRMSQTTATREQFLAYKVERDDSHVCSECGRGGMWEVVGPDGMAMGVLFSDETDAHELAGMLNAAFEMGSRTSKLKEQQ